MAKHFLYLANNRLVSLATQRARIVARREFAVSPAGVAEFERHLAGMAEMPVHIFIDLTEEDFRLDTIPHVRASDREAILARKLGQIYRATPFRHAILQGREPEGRRDDRVVYTAITNPEVLRPWLDAIERLRVPLAGIHSTAVFSGALLEELDLVFPHTLLVTFAPGGAMRQSYFRDREIKFSRLTPVDLEEGETLGTMIAEETTRTWQYLDSLRHFGPDDRLEVCVVVHANDMPAVQAAVRDFAQIQYRLLDIGDVALKLGLKPPPLGSSAEEVLVHLFLVHPVENHFASPEQRRFAMLRTTRILLNQLSIGLIAAGVAWGAWSVSRAFQTTETDRKLAREVADLNREYDAIARSLPSFGVNGATMRDAVAFYDSTIRTRPAMDDFVLPLSRVLDGHPEVRLTQLTWQATDDPKSVPPLQPIASSKAPPVKALNKAAEAAPPPPPDDAALPFTAGRYEVAMIEATVHVPNNDYRGALEEVERLAADIGRVRGYSADIVESPLDVRPSLVLQGQLPDKEPAFMEPRFVLRVTRERGAA